MPAESSSDPAAVTPGAAAPTLRWPGRVALLLLNTLPLAHLLAVLATLLTPATLTWPARLALAAGVLYLLPPLLARAVLHAWPVRQTRSAAGSREFFVWWATFQLQVIFCRFPALEELLRVVPGLYSQWLRLWGARIGRFTYWAAGTLLTDRSFLHVGDDVVFGAGVRLNAHVLTRGADGRVELLLAPVRIGHRALVGGYSLLTAGTELADDEASRAFLISPPFSRWRAGRRDRTPAAAAHEHE